MFLKDTMMEMIGSITSTQNVTVDDIARHVHLNKKQFDNRLYQNNGQQFKIDEILAIQEKYKVTHFTDWICASTGKGGVFVECQSKDELDTVELFTLQMKEQCSKAEFDQFYAEAILDGVITSEEKAKLDEYHQKVFQARKTKLNATYALYSKD